MNILIIGGAGLIGSHATRMMCDLSYNVVVYDNIDTIISDAYNFYKGQR